MPRIETKPVKLGHYRRPDLVYDLENGVTLCFLHHQWVHDHPREAEKIGLLSFATYEAAQKTKQP